MDSCCKNFAPIYKEDDRIILVGDGVKASKESRKMPSIKKLHQELRFVFFKRNGINSILVSTDLNLNTETIIRLYSYRFKIECTFRELKQVIGTFSYQFWSKSIPLKCMLYVVQLQLDYCN